MKKLILILFIFATPLFAQQPTNTITVIGEAIQETIEIEKYNITIEIKEVLADGYTNLETISIPQLVNNYKSKLNNLGLNFNELKENTVYNNTNTYNIFSYTYSTSIVDNLKKVLSIKMQGITSWVTIIGKEKTNTYIAKLNAEAIQDAKNKANLIAQNINKKVGNILSIEDTNHKQQFYLITHKPDEKEKYYVKVSFSLENL